MARAVKSTTIAIRDGIGARLLELGFEQKSSRLYRRETGDLSEWVQFNVRPDETFREEYGVYDHALKAYLSRYIDPEERYDEIPGAKQPAHVIAESRDYPRTEAYNAYEAWKKARRIWRPMDYFREPSSNSLHPFQRYLSEDARWLARDDPAGCAEASQASWRAWIEPLRDELITDPKAVARYVLECMDGRANVRILLNVYLGDRAAAKTIAEEIIARDGQPPSKKIIKRDRANSIASGISVEEMIRDKTEASTLAAQEMRALRDVLEL